MKFIFFKINKPKTNKQTKKNERRNITYAPRVINCECALHYIDKANQYNS